MGRFRSANYYCAWLKAEAVQTQYHETPRTSHVYTHVLREPPTDHLPPSTHGATYGYKELRPDGITIHHHADVSRLAQSILPNGHGPRLRWHLPHTPRTKACRWRDHGGDGYM